MIVLGVDPGAKTGWCRYDSEDRRVIDSGHFVEWDIDCPTHGDVVVIERPVAHGPTRPQVVDCAYVAGRLFERLVNSRAGREVVELTRLQVKQALTLATSNEVRVVNDATAWAALNLLHGDGCDKRACETLDRQTFNKVAGEH